MAFDTFGEFKALRGRIPLKLGRDHGSRYSGILGVVGRSQEDPIPLSNMSVLKTSPRICFLHSCTATVTINLVFLLQHTNTVKSLPHK